jgi:hypothetical protein
MEQVHRFRLVLDEDDNDYGWAFSPTHALEFEVPPYPPIVEEKLALLKLSPIGKEVGGIGKRKLTHVFYLHFTDAELENLKSDLNKMESENA